MRLQYIAAPTGLSTPLRWLLPFKLLLCIAILLPPLIAFGQASLTPFEQAALQAFSSSKQFSSISMTGNVVWTAGSLSESGTVTFKVSADGSFEETWSLPSQSHAYEATALSGGRTCTMTDPSGNQHLVADMSCFQTVPWFAPWYGMDSAVSNLAVVTDTTQSSDTADSQERLSFVAALNSTSLSPSATIQPASPLQQGSVVNVHYDLKTSLPVALGFKHLLDSNADHFIQHDITFSDYRPEGGYMLPHHIQRYIQRTLQADITIASVTAQ